jgi:hypothetical protein
MGMCFKGQWLAPPFIKGVGGNLILQGFNKNAVGFGRGTACRARDKQKVKITPSLFTKEGGELMLAGMFIW